MGVNKFIVNVIIKFIVVLICGTIAFLCVYHDYSLYSKPIGKITTVKTSGEKQQIQAEIKNGEEKGQFRDIELKYDKALVYDQKYHKGDVVICCIVLAGCAAANPSANWYGKPGFLPRP